VNSGDEARVLQQVRDHGPREAYRLLIEENDRQIRGPELDNGRAIVRAPAADSIRIHGIRPSDPEGAPALETKAKSQKVQNLRRDPRITCLVEEGDSYDQLRGVVA